jgi:F0F1-type ATP synthase epsilon subunit
MFDLTIVTPKRVIFEDAVERVLIDGDQTEYELMSFHARTLGLLREGDIIINNKISIPIKAGIVSFNDNKCLILAEEFETEVKKSS